MDAHSTPIQKFITEVQRRINRHRFFDTALWITVALGSLFLAICAYFILRGEAVPRGAYVVFGCAILVGAPLIWLFRRHSQDAAAAIADRFFALKDGLVSSKHFHEKDLRGEFYSLQEQSTQQAISELSPASIKYEKPRRLIAASVGILLLATLSAFKGPSASVLERIEQEKLTEERTSEINEFLEEELEELAKELKEKEADTDLDSDDIRKIPDTLETTKDQHKAMRQYAQLERQLRQSAARLDRKKDEQMLAAVGRELKKDEENRELGRKLENKNFRKAAEELQAMKPKPLNKERLSEQRKQLARLKAASRRMADAAQSASRRSSSQQSSEQTNDSNSSQHSPSGMQSEISDLSNAVSQFDQSLKNAQKMAMQSMLTQQQLSQCQSCQNSVQAKLDQLCKSLCKMNAQCQSQKMLLSMCNKVGQCQGFLCQKPGMSLAQCMSPKAGLGGKRAGVGSVESRTNFSDSGNTGNLTQLQGQKGAGPSETMVEDASEGSGTANARAIAQEREYAKQMESFVQREDIPPAVRNGVKRYFEGIHQGNQ